MKKTLTIVALILAITVSLIAGTMSYYYTELEELAGGSVVAKEFVLKGDGEKTFDEAIKIAPGESRQWKFNFTASSETGMDIKVKIDISEPDGLHAIEPLNFTVYENIDGDEIRKIDTISTPSGTGTYEIDLLQNENSLSKVYYVVAEWPWETDNVDDIEFAGAGYGSNLTVSVTGTQVQP